VPAPFHFDGTWQFDVPVAHLWTRLSDTSEFPNWWKWLKSLDAPDGLADGAVASAEVRAPLPYTLRFEIAVDRVIDEQLVETTVSGDLHGPATLHVTPAGEGSQARLCWDLELVNGMLRAASVLGRPAMMWAHNRIVAMGVDEFRRHALG
jgi:hypothetical protein